MKKIENLSIIYKAVPLTDWDQPYTPYKVDDAAVCEALNWALNNFSESGVASDLENDENISIGRKFNIKLSVPSSSLSFKIYKDEKEFLEDNPIETAQYFFVISDKFFSHDEKKPDWFTDYR